MVRVMYLYVGAAFLLLAAAMAAQARQEASIPQHDKLENMLRYQQAVMPPRQGGVYFIRRGSIFYNDGSGEARATILPDNKRVIAILWFAGHLVALQTGGDIYLFDGENEKEHWILLGHNTSKLLATHKYLLALTNNNQLWIYKGKPSDIRLTTGYPIFNGVTLTFLATTRREIAFNNSGLTHIKDFEVLDDNNIAVKYLNGNKETIVDLNEIPIAFEYTLTPSNELFCEYENGVRYQITQVHISKNIGKLAASVSYRVDKFMSKSSPRYSFLISQLYPYAVKSESESGTKVAIQEPFNIANFLNDLVAPASFTRWRIQSCGTSLGQR